MKPNRRSSEEKESISILRDELIKKVEKYNISMYELSKSHLIEMSEPGLAKIFNGITKFPKMENLLQIQNYIAVNYEDCKGLKLNPERTMQQRIEELEGQVEKMHLKMDIIFEIIVNAKKEEISYIEKQWHDLQPTNSETGLIE